METWYAPFPPSRLMLYRWVARYRPIRPPCGAGGFSGISAGQHAGGELVLGVEPAHETANQVRPVAGQVRLRFIDEPVHVLVHQVLRAHSVTGGDRLHERPVLRDRSGLGPGGRHDDVEY